MFMILWVKTYLRVSYLEKFLTNFQVLAAPCNRIMT